MAKILQEEDARREVSDVAQATSGRAQIYFALRDLLNELPSHRLLQSLLGHPLFDAAIAGDAAAEAAVATARSAGEDPTAVEVLAVERTRLLRGLAPGLGLPPACESSYLPVADAATADIREAQAWVTMLELYGQAGYAPDRRAPPDYLGNEVGFLGFLAGREAADWERGDSDSALAIARAELSYIEDHPGRWIGVLRDRVRASATHGFWPAVLTVIEAHLRLEREYLGELLTGEASSNVDSNAMTTSKDGGVGS